MQNPEEIIQPSEMLLCTKEVQSLFLRNLFRQRMVLAIYSKVWTVIWVFWMIAVDQTHQKFILFSSILSVHTGMLPSPFLT